jgi:hypothetical protein
MKFISAVILMLTFNSCDPGLAIEMANESESMTAIIWEFDEISEHNNYTFHELFDGYGDIRIDTLLPQSSTFVEFGLGTWDMDNNLDSLTKCLSKITIKSGNSSLIYKGEAQIKDYLKNTIIDQPKSVIRIRIRKKFGS